MSRYTEHRTLEAGPLLVADSTVQSGERMVWLGAGGMEGRWVTHAEFRAILAALVQFAEGLPPSVAGVAACEPPLQYGQARHDPADTGEADEYSDGNAAASPLGPGEDEYLSWIKQLARQHWRSAYGVPAAFEPCGKCRNRERCEERGCMDKAMSAPAPGGRGTSNHQGEGR